MANIDPLVDFYTAAKYWLLSSPFYEELRWQQQRKAHRVTEQEFLREHAWVVLNSGFREATVRKHFGYISLCFCDWESADEIVEAGQICVDTAKSAFGNSRKLNAILRMSEIISEEGFDGFLERISVDGVTGLQSLPYIGSVTCFHLAKNIGFEVAKPDRHLERLAKLYQFSDSFEMCATLSDLSGDDVATIDLVLWRHLEQVASGALRTSAALPPSNRKITDEAREHTELAA